MESHGRVLMKPDGRALTPRNAHCMTEMQAYREDHLPGLADAWNRAFVGQPNFVRVGEADLRRHVTYQDSFEPANLLVARSGDRVLGFVHFGPRASFWHHASQRRTNPAEGQIHVVVAPESDRSLLHDLLTAGVDHLADAGARRVLLGPSWVYGAQPFYNGIAGAYEFPGLSSVRHTMIEVAAEAGFVPLAEYATPEIDFSDREHLAALRGVAQALQPRTREWRLRLRTRPLVSSFFAGRTAAELSHGRETIAMTAYGPWTEYAHEYGRRLFGITSVQVAPRWRGKGLGKLIMIRAMEAALKEGAEAVHLHVWRDNTVAWNLYHRALGFQPTYSWVTLVKQLAS
jgi:GNAT superfamily N-acetyltransferase